MPKRTKLTGGMSKSKAPRIPYQKDTSRSMKKLTRGGQYVSDMTGGKIERLITRLGLDHELLQGLQGGNATERYHLLEADYNDLRDVRADRGDPTGFITRSDSTITFTDGTRTFEIAPTGTDFTYYEDGVSYVSTGDSVVITDVTGLHVIYYDGATLTAVANPSTAATVALIEGKTLVCYLYWNATTSEAIYVGEERHGIQMDGATHAYIHFNNGLAYRNGLGINTLTADQNGSSDTHAQFGLDAGGVSDEDIYLSLGAVTSTTGLPIYYMLGASAVWTRKVNAGFSVYNAPAGRLYYNQYTGGAWQLTEVSNNDFVLCHVFATTEKDKPLIAIMGQALYTRKSLARDGALVEITSLITNDLLFPEIRPLYTIIFKTSSSYSNAVKAIVQSADEGDYVDWRSQLISRVELTTSDHNLLTNKQGGTADEYYHATSAEYIQLQADLANVIVTQAQAADTLPQTLGTASIGTSTDYMREDAVISDQLPGTTVLADGATAATQAATDNSTKLATTQHVTDKIAHLNLFAYQGAITNADTNPNYPAADAGDIYIITTNDGKIGGSSGPTVEIGDTIFCITDSTPAGDHATVGSNWVIGQANLQPELYALLSGAAFTGDISITGGSLDMTGTDTHFAPPSLTTAERDALSPSEGWVIFNETDKELQQYANSAWGSIGGGSSMVVEKAAHGWTDADVGTKVYKGTGAGVYEVADRDSEAAAESFWYISKYISSSKFELRSVGRLVRTTAQWDTLLGTSGGLTEKDIYYLAANGAANVLTTTAPEDDTETDKPVAIALSSTEMWYFDYRGIVLGDDFAGRTSISSSALSSGSGVFEWTHNLGSSSPVTAVYDSNGELVIPDVDVVSSDRIDLDFGSSYADLDTPLSAVAVVAGANVTYNISSDTPEDIGTAAAGSSGDAAAKDHVHAGPDWAKFELSTNQTSNVSTNDHIQFDTVRKAGFSDLVFYKDDLSTVADWDSDTGQDLGIILLKTGFSYKIILDCDSIFSNAGGILNFGLYDRTNSANLISTGYRYPNNYSGSHDLVQTNKGPLVDVITPSADMKIEVRLTYAAHVTLNNDGTYLLIEKIKLEE